MTGCDLLPSGENERSDQDEVFAQTDGGYPIAIYHWPNPPDWYEKEQFDTAGFRLRTREAIDFWSRVLAPTDASPRYVPADWLPDKYVRSHGETVSGMVITLNFRSTGFSFASAETGYREGGRFLPPDRGRPLTGQIYFTPGSGWGDNAFTKHVVAHEIGHALGFTAPFDDERILAAMNELYGTRNSQATVLKTKSGSHWWCGGDVMGGPGYEDHHALFVSDLTVIAMHESYRFETDGQRVRPIASKGAISSCWRTP